MATSSCTLCTQATLLLAYSQQNQLFAVKLVIHIVRSAQAFVSHEHDSADMWWRKVPSCMQWNVRLALCYSFAVFVRHTAVPG